MSNFNFVKAVRQISMPPTTKLVAITLATYADYETGECYPSIQTLMDDTGLSNRAVGLHIKHIESLGILVVDRSNGRRSYYRFDMENLTKAVTQGHSSDNESSDSGDNTSDSDDSEAVTLTQQPVTLVQKAVTQGHTNYQEQPIEQPIERSSNTHDEKNSQPTVQFVQYHNFDLAKISVIELDQKYPTLKSDFIELSKPRHPDLDQHDLENLFDEFGNWFASSNDYGKQSFKTAQKWAVAFLTWINNNKHKLINRKAKSNVTEQSGRNKPIQTPSAYQTKQENVNRWLRYGQKVREEQQQESSIIDVVPEPPKNFLIEEVGHA
ncbi:MULTISPECIES: helix-turn-helix domain-containing protein [Acinetobacter]|uniref:helix-turn-helix domain-containing protein n=1 Tax=Acinetobacter TaxID=469 RepID=UPI0002AEA25A|nr:MULTISPECIES: helix-turn-helix domain-containing protein [Acinetobacter]ELW85697.1 DNA-binding helix-turn-helix protein [Acinetobacter sp. WC-743]MBJ8427861.1 helix-turn-helix domain-containing protein [Acinetobacter bereziniae]